MAATEPPGLCRGAVPPRRSRGGDDRRIAPTQGQYVVRYTPSLEQDFPVLRLSRCIAIDRASALSHSFSMPKPELLETFPNPYPGRDYEIAMECPEFTSLCPLGGIESDADELRALRGRRAGLRHDLHHLRAGRPVHRAQEPQALSVELSRRRDFLRARGQSHSRRRRAA